MTVCIGVIGVGWPGQRHIEGYKRRDDVRVIALADVNTELASKVNAEFDLSAELYSDYRDLLASAAVDAVSICTPNFLHAPMAVDAIEAGKHVLLEKPLANTVEAGERIARAVEASDRVFMLALNNRFRPDSRLIKGQIEAGALGDIYYAKTGWLRRDWNMGVRGWFTTRELSGGGPLIDLGVHMLDLALWFMGNPRPVGVTGSVYYQLAERASGRGGQVDVEDLAAAFVKLDNGATITLDVSWSSFIEHPDYVYSQLFGTSGGVRLERYPGTDDLRIYTEQGGVPLVQSPRFDAYRMTADRQYMLHESFAGETGHFIDCIESGGTPGATVVQGLDVLKVLDAIYRSAESGHEVFIERGKGTG